jgi:DNA mismatch endonuclease (patch repair protein)
MADVFSKAKRSAVMSRIRSRGNMGTELALAKLFRRHKITGWRRQIKIQVTSDKWRVKSKRHTSPQRGEEKKHASVSSLVTRHSSLSVRPDFIFPKLRLAVFVDGCFWHCCPKHGTKPKGNAVFWRRKFSRNKKRDALVSRALRRNGWRVIRIWECALKKNPLNCLRRIQRVRKTPKTRKRFFDTSP